MLNKPDVVAKVAEKTGLTKRDVSAVVEAFIKLVEESLVQGVAVQLIGFGKFEVRHRAARKGRNPQTGAQLDIPAVDSPAFKAGQSLKDAVAKK